MAARRDGSGLDATVEQTAQQEDDRSRPTAPAGATPVRRRPSGEPPPLPRPVSRSTRICASLIGLTVVLWVAFMVDPLRRAVTEVDAALLGLIERVRADLLTDVAEVVAELGSTWTIRVVAWATLVMLVVLRRFQHLITYLVVLLVVTALNSMLAIEIGRMRPAEVAIIGSWQGYAHPSAPVAGLGVVLVAVLRALVPVGRWRARGAWAAAAALAALCTARLYLGVDHPTDVAAGLVTGVALPVVAFRLAVPDDDLPLRHRRGRRAHLDVGGRRGGAIVAAVESQLGVRVERVEPFALAGSSGSTPLRLHLSDEEGGGFLFAKLYALTHLRSDRLYKLVRTVLYGRLEDELPFNAVRRLVAYEDHMLRLMRDAGVRTARPHGMVEITPEREYLVVTEFLTGAVEVASAEVDDAVIGDALASVRRLWDAGLAHRDIKPSNVLVRDGRVFLIDVAFGEARPTPWRQAVDLANMMLTLALRSTPEQVYEQALAHFTEGDLAEAFAASRGITVPTGLRSALRADGRDLLGRFRELAPDRPPVSIQRWGVRRLGLTASLLAAVVVAAALVSVNLRLAGLL